MVLAIRPQCGAYRTAGDETGNHSWCRRDATGDTPPRPIESERLDIHRPIFECSGSEGMGYVLRNNPSASEMLLTTDDVAFAFMQGLSTTWLMREAQEWIVLWCWPSR